MNIQLSWKGAWIALTSLLSRKASKAWMIAIGALLHSDVKSPVHIPTS